MGLLSKIFNTDKLAYILREEEEFSVAAPKQWNVETLTVGDTITPDMFKNQHRYYNFDLYIKEIGYDDDYLDDPESAGYYVITEFGDSVEGNLKYLDNQLTWGLGEINKFLKPKYKVVTTDLSESEDEFSVDAPQNWNVEYLSIGDQITPDMWNQKSKLIWDLLDTDINKTYKIIGFFEEWDGYEEQEDFDPIFVELEDEVGHISTESLTVLQGSLNPEFKITQNKNLIEVEDEFNVAAPPEWNEIELGVGDLITPENSTTGNYYLIKSIGGNHVWVRKGTLDYNGEFKPQHSVDFHTHLNILQSRMKPGFTITQNKNLNEVEDEFNVDAPQEWNVEHLSEGDIITSDMWISPRNRIYNGDKNIDILEVGYDGEGPFVVLQYPEGFQMGYNLEEVNENLKPQYQVVQPLSEEDEFNVDAPEDWNITELKIGDIITPDMWQDVKYTNSFRLSPWFIKKIENHGENGKLVHVKNDLDSSYWIEISSFNKDYLKPQYQVTDSLSESDDKDFSVEAPKEWNVEQLSVGDTIDPNMWNKKKTMGLLHTDIEFNETYKISKIQDLGDWWDVDQEGFDVYEVELVDSQGEEVIDYLDNINTWLKPEFKVVKTMMESDDDEDFNVKAPEDWNVTELGVGDIITSNMFKTKEDVKFWMNSTNKLQILTIFKEYDEWIVVLGLPNTNERYVSWVIRNANKDLKPQYKIEQNLTESEEDFNVDAPEDWNVIELGVGDQITPDMWQSKQYDLNIQGKTAEITDIGVDDKGPYVVLAHNNPYWSLDYDIDVINDLLKPQYKIEQNLIESDEDFNVDAPAEWDITELKKGDYIMPDMWVKDIDDFFTGQSESKYLFKQLTSKPIKITGVMRGDELYFEVAGLYFILTNDFLLPQYKVVGDFGMYESNEDEFNVDAPSEWDVTELSKGDIITPDMWKDDLINWDHDIKIDGFKPYSNDVGYMVYLKHLDSFLTPQVFDLGEINGWLKNTYRVEVNDLMESDEDDFSVDAPAEWGITYLGVGDTIKGKMWNWKNIIKWCNRVAGDNHVELNELIKRWEDIYDEGVTIDKIVKYGDGYHVEFDSNSAFLRFGPSVSSVNKWLSDGYEIEPSLTESEDDFSVDAPAKWNVTDLEIGDYIYPDMINVPRDKRKWNHYHNMLADPKRTDGWQITGFKKHDGRDLVRLEYNGVGNFFDVNLINSTLKQYRIFLPTNETKLSSLLEIDDEFNVDAPQEWNDDYLTIGDIVTPDMWNDEVRSLKNFKDFNTVLNNSLTIKNIYPQKRGGDPGYLIVFNDHTSVHSSFLDPKYKIDPPLNESDDEFSVDAPLEWNQESLSTGDIITPDMWDKQKFFDDPTMNSIKVYNEAIEDSWIIESINYHEIDNAWFVNLKSSTTDHKYFGLWSDPEELNNINNVLKDNYKIYPPNTLLESDDEEDFSVDAPENWNVTELGIGSILDSSNLKMQDPMKKFEIVDFKVSLFPWETNKAVLKVFQLKDEPIPGTSRTTRQWKYIRNIFVELKILNDRLKDGYKIEPSLNENEDEDFSVDAPQEWNVEYLTTGDTITPDMWDQNKIGRRKDFFSKPIKIDSIGYNEFDNEEEEPLVGLDLGDTTTEYDIDFVNYLLKHEFKVVQNKNLTEEEDFNVDAPAEWNQHELKVGDYFNDIEGKVYTHKKDLPKDSRGLTYEIVYIGPNEGEYHRSAYYDHNIIAFKRTGSDNVYSFTVEHFNRTRGPKLNAYINLPDRFNLNEDEEDFSVDAPKSWNINYLNVGDTITPNMWNKRETKQSTFDFSFNKPLKINWIGNDGIEDFIVFEESDLVTYAVEDIHDLLKPEYRISLSNLQESEEDFNVDALPEWDIIELKVGDYINSNMLNPKGNDYTWFSRRKLFIEDIYFDECWTVNLLHVESGYHTPFCIDYINEDVLNDKYRIMTSLNELLEIDDEFDVEAPQKWDVIELGVGDKITKDMIKSPGFIHQIGENFQMDFPGVITKIYKSGPIDDDQYWGIRIKFKNKGWKKYLPQSEDVKLGLGLSLDDFNEDVLKPQYQIQKPIFELSTLLENEEDFNVNAPDEWNVELLTVGDTVTPEMWGYEQINSWFDISKPLNIEDIGEDDGGWWVQLGRNEAPFDLDEVNDFLKPQYKIVPYNLEESDDEFNIDAPEEWNYDYWEPTKGMRDDEYYKSFDEFVTRILRKYGVEDEFIEIYLDEVFNFGDFTNYEGISSGDLYEDFQQWIRAQDETSEWYDDMNEEEDFSVDAPEDWWEYDGDVELMFQDTYWYEDENGKEAIVERDGGGIVNINDLEQYSYSDWKPFTGNPTSENLTKWYYSINWDTDLVEMFDFDDSLFEVEEDFDWSTAENIDMDRTGFKIRAVSTLKEADDEFTVKAPQKWDIVYLNKGDFLDNTNSTFNDPNVKYEIGNITSDGEIEVKKYINRGSGFEPQFDRFMKTRKGIVKAKLKPGFDIEAFSK